MIIKILIVLGILTLSFLILTIYSCCIVSGRCSEKEGRIVYEKNRFE